jgi:hypothetical protein
MNNVVEAENLKAIKTMDSQSNDFKKKYKYAPAGATIKELSVKSQFQNKAT